MARQMTQEDRRRIDHLLAVGMTINDIATDLGCNKTMVLHEIIARSVPCDRGYGCSNTLCAKFESCTRIKGYGGNPKRLFRCTPGCFKACPEFIERTCGRLRVAFQVCNGRECLRNCPMHKRVYDADDAEANRQGKLHESRRGIHPDDAQVVLKRNGVTSPVKK